MYILEGNIGVGKSTFLELLNKHAPELTVVQEPKENWASHANGQSLLASFYQNPHRWAYTIETLAMISRVKDHTSQQKNPNQLCLMERSVYSGHYCFAKNDHAQGYLDSTEWDVYQRWADFLVHNVCRPPLGFIYLQATPDVCFSRMRKRARPGEENMSLEYISQIHDWHEKFLIQQIDVQESIKRVPVLVLDAHHNLLEDTQLLFEYVERVRNFMMLPLFETGVAKSAANAI